MAYDGAIRPMKRLDLAIIAVVAVVAFAVVGLFLARRQHTFTVTFNDANGISAGDAVYYNGARIGEVRRVTSGRPTAVDVHISRDYERQMHRKLSFFVERESMLGSGRRLAAYDCAGPEPGARINRGEVVEGNESTMTWLACKAADRAGPIAGAAAALAASLATTGPGRAIAESMKQHAEAARQIGDEQWEAFRREQLPKIEQQAREYIAQLERDGKLEEAKRFVEQFNAWLKATAEGSRK